MPVAHLSVSLRLGRLDLRGRAGLNSIHSGSDRSERPRRLAKLVARPLARGRMRGCASGHASRVAIG